MGLGMSASSHEKSPISKFHFSCLLSGTKIQAQKFDRPKSEFFCAGSRHKKCRQKSAITKVDFFVAEGDMKNDGSHFFWLPQA